MIAFLREKIKALENNRNKIGEIVSEVEVALEQVLIDRKVKTIRRVYVLDPKYKYKVGWVVDSDLDCCMICFRSFGWIRFRHHCRACGMLVCAPCSPFKTFIPLIDEDGGSRVCSSCFGLKQNVSNSSDPENIFSPTNPVVRGFVHRRNSMGRSSMVDRPSDASSQIISRNISNYNVVPQSLAGKVGWEIEADGSMVTHKNPLSPMNERLDDLLGPVESDEEKYEYSQNDHIVSDLTIDDVTESSYTYGGKEDIILDRLKRFEIMQRPKYLEAYQKMRRLISPNVTKTKLKRMIADGVPAELAKRIWETKALWLICMHSDDIHKVHVGDLRSKYDFHGLDLIEMRAVWYVLPEWNEVLDSVKAEWKEGFKVKLNEMAYKDSIGTLSDRDRRHPVYENCDDLTIYDPSIPIERRFVRSASYSHPAVESPNISESSGAISNPITPENTSGSLTPMSSLLIKMKTPVTNHRTATKSQNGFSSYKIDTLGEVSENSSDMDVSLFSQSINRRNDLRFGEEISKSDDSLDSLLNESINYSARNINSVMRLNDSSILQSSVRKPLFQSHISVETPIDSPSNVSHQINFKDESLESLETPIQYSEMKSPQTLNMDDDGILYPGDVDSSSDASCTYNEPSQACRTDSSISNALTPMSASPLRNKLSFVSPLLRNAAKNNVVKHQQAIKQIPSEPADYSPVLMESTPLSYDSTKSEVSVSSVESVKNIIPFSPHGSPNRSSLKQQSNGAITDRKFNATLFEDLIFSGNARDAREMLKELGIKNPTLPKKDYATDLLLRCMELTENMQEPLLTIVVLVDMLGADVNAISPLTGSTPLGSLFSNEEICSYLIARGADILQDDRNNACPLSASIEIGADWLLEDFRENNHEKELLEIGNKERIKKYTSCLIIGGFGTIAKSITLDMQAVNYTPEEATELLSKCCGNFDNMNQPMETFELLEKLGASVREL